MTHFAASRHGVFTVLEPLTDLAKRFLASLGFRPGALTLAYNDFREVRFAALDAGFTMEVAR